MANVWLDYPEYFDNTFTNTEEELTEEEKALLEMQMLLEQEEEAPVEEEVIEEQEVRYISTKGIEEEEKEIIEDIEEDSVWSMSEYFEDNKPLAEKGKQLEYVGTAEDVPFYYDKDQKNYVTVHTRGHKLEDGSFVNFPSLLPNGRVIYSLDPRTENNYNIKELYIKKISKLDF